MGLPIFGVYTCVKSIARKHAVKELAELKLFIRANCNRKTVFLEIDSNPNWVIQKYHLQEKFWEEAGYLFYAEKIRMKHVKSKKLMDMEITCKASKDSVTRSKEGVILVSGKNLKMGKPLRKLAKVKADLQVECARSMVLLEGESKANWNAQKYQLRKRYWEKSNYHYYTERIQVKHMKTKKLVNVNVTCKVSKDSLTRQKEGVLLVAAKNLKTNKPLAGWKRLLPYR